MVKLNKHNSYKVGMNEVKGLNKAMHSVMSPLQAFIKDKIYWNNCELTDTEYLSRDGFMAYSENFGGVELSLVVPKCEEYEFGFLRFGECDDQECDHDRECMYEGEGHLDAKFRVWLKFEGIKDGVMNFYLYCGGGNDDAPYFRVKNEVTVFESEFTAKTIKEFKAKAKIQVNKLLKQLNKGS